MDFYQQQQIPQIGGGGGSGGGLTRYRSAPSGYFSSFLTGNSGGGSGGFGDEEFGKLFNPRGSSPDTQQSFDRLMNSTTDGNSPRAPPRKKPTPADKPPRSDYSSRISALEASYNKLPAASIKTEQVEAGAGLFRQSSLPAGLFDSIHIETGVENSGKDPGGSIPDFPMSPWDDSTILSDDFIKGLTEDDTKTTFAKTMDSDDQKNEFGNRPPIPLSHHLSLPKSALEKLVQDSIPCRLRAKRGFATHPRSIAERVRRNKISERTRKLQELVPNMDKQTNTADMLDLAVDYIKDLQRQVKALSDNRAKCTCSIETQGLLHKSNQ